GTIFLSIAAIPMIFVAIGVKLTSKGPILFKQRRYGLNGEVIEILKFRSMTVMEDGGDVKQATKNDARITPFGSFLRRSSLDELPQLIHVVTGKMSLVGPRPHAISHNELYRRKIEGYMLRHKVKPGLTGWAQVNGWRGETDTIEKMEKRIEYDLDYIRNWGIMLDLKIVFMTIAGGLASKNAY
ncbi:MAG: exopolysaccharide biosynthesis polyprenyl glycosylphosphotransferase, partial [Myxococcales bacterium]|nr:exopolysaccharide biosynthesis polyprenyl glycosylphosphotransferase [Myxococcales bacterium]